jgi:lipid II:glycine glycyltransferase (peptidoglycan interpeptide bridge formation enzyme)
MIIDIHGDPMDAMSPDARKKSRRGERRCVAIRRDGSELVPALVRLLKQMADRKSVLVRDEQYLHQLLTTYPSDSIAIFAAEAAGEIIAATLAVFAGCTAYELYRAFDYSKRNLYPNEALQVAVMKWAKEHGCLFYDMGGSCTSWPVRATDKGYGVYRFKRELGAQSIVSAPYVDLVYRPLLYCGCWLAENIGMPFVIEKGFGKFRVAFERVYENR